MKKIMEWNAFRSIFHSKILYHKSVTYKRKWNEIYSHSKKWNEICKQAEFKIKVSYIDFDDEKIFCCLSKQEAENRSVICKDVSFIWDYRPKNDRKRKVQNAVINCAYDAASETIMENVEESIEEEVKAETLDICKESALSN